MARYSQYWFLQGLSCTALAVAAPHVCQCVASVLQHASQPHVVTNPLSVSCRLQCHVPSPQSASPEAQLQPHTPQRTALHLQTSPSPRPQTRYVLAGVKLPEVPGPCSPIQGRAVTSVEYPTPREQAYRQLKRFHSQRPSTSTKTAAGAPPTRQQCLLIESSCLARAPQHVQQPLTSPGPLHGTTVLSSCATQQGRDAQTVSAQLPLHFTSAGQRVLGQCRDPSLQQLVPALDELHRSCMEEAPQPGAAGHSPAHPGSHTCCGSTLPSGQLHRHLSR